MGVPLPYLTVPYLALHMHAHLLRGSLILFGRLSVSREPPSADRFDCFRVRPRVSPVGRRPAQLKEIGVVDEVIWEPAQGETFESFPVMAG